MKRNHEYSATQVQASNDPKHVHASCALMMYRRQSAVDSPWRYGPKAALAVLLFVTNIVVGSLILSLLEGWSTADALYWGVITVTTVGPNGPSARSCTP